MEVDGAEEIESTVGSGLSEGAAASDTSIEVGTHVELTEAAAAAAAATLVEGAVAEDISAADVSAGAVEVDACCG